MALPLSANLYGTFIWVSAVTTAPPSRSARFENRTLYSGERAQSKMTATTAMTAAATPSWTVRGHWAGLDKAGKRASKALGWLIGNLGCGPCHSRPNQPYAERTT